MEYSSETTRPLIVSTIITVSSVWLVLLQSIFGSSEAQRKLFVILILCELHITDQVPNYDKLRKVHWMRPIGHLIMVNDFEFLQKINLTS